MSYDAFKAKVNALVRRCGASQNVRFFNDEEKGRFFANCEDGVTIIGNRDSLRVTVKWGSGHCSVAAI